MRPAWCRPTSASISSGSRQSGVARPDERRVAQRWRKDPAGWRIVEWKDDRHVDEPRRAADLHRDHRGRARRHRGVPPAVEHAARRVVAIARRRADARLERPPWRVGRRRRWRRPRRSLRRAAGRPAQPAVPRPRRRHVRGHHRPRRRRRPRRHRAVAVRRRRQRRRPGSRARDRHAAAAVRQRRQGHVRAGRRRVHLRQAAAGPAHAVCRWPTTIATASSTSTSASTRTSSAPARRKPARRCRTTTPATARRASCSATTARAASSTPPRPPGSTPATTAITSPRRGPTTTRTAGPICWSPTISASRTSIATWARAAGRSASRTSPSRRACWITAPA